MFGFFFVFPMFSLSSTSSTDGIVVPPLGNCRGPGEPRMQQFPFRASISDLPPSLASPKLFSPG